MPYPSLTLYPATSGVYPAFVAGTPPVAITPSTRYSAVGNTRVYFLYTISATSLIPTRAELTAGTDLTPEIADWSGWTLSSAGIPILDLTDVFERSVFGKIVTPSSSITFYASKAGMPRGGLYPAPSVYPGPTLYPSSGTSSAPVDARSIFTANVTNGYIVFMDGGDVAGYLAEAYPVTVSSVALSRSIKGDQADKMVVTFAIGTKPSQGVPVPA